jgi:hypothetical protein
MTDSNNWFQQWPGWQALVSTAQRRGADSFGLMYGDGKNRRAMRFGRGSFMLDWNGKGGAFVFHVADGSDPFNTAWVRQLGSPVAPKVRRAQGVWQRRYEQGVVVVNARSEAVTYASREFRELSAPATQGSSPMRAATFADALFGARAYRVSRHRSGPVEFVGGVPEFWRQLKRGRSTRVGPRTGTGGPRHPLAES